MFPNVFLLRFCHNHCFHRILRYYITYLRIFQHWLIFLYILMFAVFFSQNIYTDSLYSTCSLKTRAKFSLWVPLRHMYIFLFLFDLIFSRIFQKFTLTFPMFPILLRYFNILGWLDIFQNISRIYFGMFPRLFRCFLFLPWCQG